MPSTQSPDVEQRLMQIVKSVLEHGADSTIAKFELEVIRALLDKAAPVPDVPTRWGADYANLRRCSSVAEVQAVVQEARSARKTLRVAGAQHSAPQAIFAHGDSNQIHVKLEGDLRKVEVLREDPAAGRLVVRAGAGANLGIDPSDPSSNADNSFNRTVDKLGYALPILGGMSHHTLGGFMSTSTAGGSLSYGFGDSLIGIELVDGLGNVRKLARGADDFDAAAVSMGLFGIITHVTLELGRRYLVKGHEETVATKDSFLASGPKLYDALQHNTYVHAVWFAQAGVDRALQFTATQAPVTEAIVPYVHVLANKSRNYLAALALSAANALDYSRMELEHKLADFIIKVMNPIDAQPKAFCDQWYLALPNDDQALIDQVIRVQFTEIWIDIERTAEVYTALASLLQSDALAAGNFGVEVYCAKRSAFWMSQSYGRDVIRIDPYFWEYNPAGDLQEFFMRYWKVLLEIPTARLHWGEHLPSVGTRFSAFTIGPDYVRKAFPKFPEWLARRADFDPQQLFVTDYWRTMFGIPAT